MSDLTPINKTIVFLEDNLDFRNLLVKHTNKNIDKENTTVESFNNPAEFNAYLEKEQDKLRDEVRQLLIVSDGNMNDVPGGSDKFEDNHRGTKAVLEAWKQMFKESGINFFLGFLTGNPNQLGSDSSSIPENTVEKTIQASSHYQLNSTDNKDIPIICKPTSMSTITALLNKFDTMIRTELAA